MYRNGLPIVDLLHINDAVFACAAALKANRTGIFNIGSGIGLTTFEIAQKIIERSGSNSKIGHIDIDEYVSNVVLDSSYAKKILHWVPTVDLLRRIHDIKQ
jgi:nucleoside-diphosphate-sugar epimerase